MSREEVARLCGVSRQTIANIEKGSCVPSIPIILIISKALGVKFDTLVSYARRNPSFRVKAQEFRIPGQLIPGMYFKAGEKAVAYMELYKGTSYRLKRHIVQMVYVIEGEVIAQCHCCQQLAHAGQYIICEGEDCKISTASNQARIISIILPNKNPIVGQMIAEQIANPSGLLNLSNSTDEPKVIEQQDFDFSVLKFIRNSRSLTLAELAKASGQTAASIMAIEQNKKIPSFQVLDSIVQSLNIGLVDFLTLCSKGCCQIRDSIVAEMTGTGTTSGQTIEMPLYQMKYQKYRMGYLDNTSGQKVTVREDEMHVVEEKFIFVVKDKMTVTLEDKSYEINAGEGLIFDSRSSHSFVVGESNNSFAILSLRPDTLYDETIDDDSKSHTILKFGDIRKL